MINARAVPMGLGQSVDLRHADASTEGRAAAWGGNGFVTHPIKVETWFIGTRTAIAAGISVLLLLRLVLTISK